MSAARLAQFGIKIRKRVERGPTDILKALASTVKVIPSEPTPVLQDDPYLLPSKNFLLSQFYFSKNSGKSTARFLLNRHPEIFYRDHSEPKILAFLPDEEFKEEMDLSEEDLIWCLDNNDVANGLLAYHSLKNKNIKLQDETLMRFFEMICYTNEKNILTPMQAELVSIVPHDKHLVDMTWNEKGLASKLFNEIKDLDPPRIYSTMIAGLGKFNQHATAKQVYEDFKNNHPDDGLYPVAYSSLLNSLPNLHSSRQPCIEAIDDITGHMEAHSVVPDLRVFNSILKCYSLYRIERNHIQDAFKLINDMQSLGIDPSLRTFFVLFYILGKDRNGLPHTQLIEEILGYIDKRKDILEIRDPADIGFFNSSIKVIANRTNNYNLARKLYKIYLKNPNLFPTLMSKRHYLDQHFRLMITSDSLKNTIEFYDANVPMNFQPSADVYDILADALELYEASDDIILKIGLDTIKYRISDNLKNDAIFKKVPAYNKAKEENEKERERLYNMRLSR